MQHKKNTESDFLTFWNAYCLKRDRIAAERAWKKLSAKDKQAAMAGIAPYRESCERSGIRMMYAQGYLNHHRWEDEYLPEATASVAAYGDKPTKPMPPQEPAITHDGRGYRVKDGLTQEERATFALLKGDLRRAWSRHLDAANGKALDELLAGLELYGIDDRRKLVCMYNERVNIDREFVISWYWDPTQFDAIVAARFNNYQWTKF
jgi:hypothetical protein